MKQIVLFSVVASTMIMAGGDIAPVEPVVEAPIVQETTSGWELGGQLVAFTMSVDKFGTEDLFSANTTYAAIGAQLSAVNKNIFAGFGAGVEVSAIQQDSTLTNIPDATPTNPNNFAFPFFGGGDAQVKSADITQAYLTYGFGNTSIKVGRQTLPMSLSPFAFSEGWQMFKNTMEAALVVNTDLPDTTLVYAAVGKTNSSIGRLDNFEDMGTRWGTASTVRFDTVHMLTAQNKSIDGLTLTGTYYYAPFAHDTSLGANIIWGDAKFNISDYSIALQGGQLTADGLEDTTAFGAKVGAKFGIFDASVAYSSANGPLRITNLATFQSQLPNVNIKSPLYTQMVLNNIGVHHAQDADYIKVAASAKALGGVFGVAYGQTLDNRNVEDGTTINAYGENPVEVDVTYKTQITENTTLFAAYVYVDRDDTANVEDANNFLRFWARYNF